MSIQVSIPDAVADEIFWYLLEVIESGKRASDEAWQWLDGNLKPKKQAQVWPRLEQAEKCYPIDKPGDRRIT